MATARTMSDGSDNTAAEDAAADLVADHPGLTVVGRVGWLTKGLVYVIAGMLAIFVALDALGWREDAGDEEASPTGALKSVARHTLGAPLLIALAAGLLVYAGWRLVSAALPGEASLAVYATRVGYVASAVMYISFAYTALRLLVESPEQTDGNSTVSDVTGGVMRHTGGRIVIALVGVVLGGVAVYRADKGRRSDVTDEMDTSGMSARRLRLVRRFGSVGEVGRGLAVALIGFFLVRAAITYDPAEATGLDGALRRASGHLWTKVMVPVIAVGFICYGVYCLVTFRRRRFEPPT